MSPRELDEDDVRVRPGRSSRPRTRRRPEHAQAEQGLVVAVDRGRYQVEVGEISVTAMRARELGRRAVVVGDQVDVVGDTSGGEGALARIVRVGERTGMLRRSADDTDPTERPVVANADHLVIVTSVVRPEPSALFLDRCLVAAHDAGTAPVLVITKADLADPRPLADDYAPLVEAVVLRARGDDGESAAHIAQLVGGGLSVLFGRSGVGKSTLVNELVPTRHRATGEISDATGKGRHISSSAVALPLPGGGHVVDTPGVRSLGLAHVSRDGLVAGFTDLAPLTAECPPLCPHLPPSCALDEAIVRTGIGAHRLDSLRRLLTGRDDDSPHWA